MAANHALSPVGSLDDVKNEIINHITEGSCTCFKLKLPLGCAAFQSDCPPELLGTQLSDNENDVHIFFFISAMYYNTSASIMSFT